MQERSPSRVGRIAVLVAMAGLAPHTATAQGPGPIVATVRIPVPETHVEQVDIAVPTGGRASIEMMMAVWTPGFYRIEDYAGKVKDLSAKTPDGAILAAERTAKNPWRVGTGAPRRSSCLTA